MGGKGSGGMRIGAGRKRKSDAERALGGFAGKRLTRAQQQQARQAAPADMSLPVLPPPDSLQGRAREIWLELAPRAAKARTLTDTEAFAFRDLCEAIALKQRMFQEIDEVGLTYETRHVDVQAQGGDREEVIEAREIKKHPLLVDHRGWQQRVDAGMLRFKLSPMGKEVVAAAPVKDAWDDFDDGGSSSTH